VTDADLVLGLLDPDYFLGGAMALDPQAAERAVEADVAHPLALSRFEAARGVHLAVGSEMAEAARVHAAERGLDLAAHTLVAYGGAGPVHAWSVARQLHVRRILFPGHAGVESALGFLAAPPAFEVARSRTEPLPGLDAPAVTRLLETLTAEARAVVEKAGSGPVITQITADMRYRGQGAEVRVPRPEGSLDPRRLEAAFLETYAALYGRTVAGVPIEVVTWRVRCRRDTPAIDVLDRAGAETETPSDPPQLYGARRAWLPDLEAPQDIPVYRRERLRPGDRFEGPALVQEAQSTLVLGRGTARVLAGGTILAEVAP
jgi:N-methylhydantoinase A